MSEATFDTGAIYRDESWPERAFCLGADPEIFFPHFTDRQRTEEAKNICAQCDVQIECLEYALTKNERHGVWGGLTENERASLKRRGRNAVAKYLHELENDR